MTVNAIDKMIDETIAKEGGYSNNPDDAGGETMFGITKRVARANGYYGPMIKLSRNMAMMIYRAEYLIKPGFAAVAEINEKVGAELFDTGVNMGVAYPSMCFQQVLNAMNNSGKLYSDIVEDGKIGLATLTAFRCYMTARGAEAESVMLKALNGLQCARYIELARGRVANETFLFGWLRTRVGL